jgi:hypothetical protein
LETQEPSQHLLIDTGKPRPYNEKRIAGSVTLKQKLCLSTETFETARQEAIVFTHEHSTNKTVGLNSCVTKIYGLFVISEAATDNKIW